jgi:hypothetical protein
MPDGKIDLLVKSTAGHWSHPFDSADRAQVVLDEAVSHFGLQTGPGISYALKTENGSGISLSETLSQLGLQDHAVLVLQATQAQDG